MRGVKKTYQAVILGLWRSKNRVFSRCRPALQYFNLVFASLCNVHISFPNLYNKKSYYNQYRSTNNIKRILKNEEYIHLCLWVHYDHLISKFAHSQNDILRSTTKDSNADVFTTHQCSS